MNVVAGESQYEKDRRSANEFATADLSHLKNLRGLAWFERWALTFCRNSPFATFVAGLMPTKDFLTESDIATLKAHPIDLVVCTRPARRRARTHNAMGDRCHRRA